MRQHLSKGTVAKDFSLVVHYYLASAYAAATISERARRVREHQAVDWFPRVEYRFGAVLPSTLPLTADTDADFIDVVNKHYSPAIMTESMLVGGEDGRLGFASSALPLVLEHNTPNNTVSLVWAEAEKTESAPEMRPLFRRRQRHL